MSADGRKDRDEVLRYLLIDKPRFEELLRKMKLPLGDGR